LEEINNNEDDEVDRILGKRSFDGRLISNSKPSLAEKAF
jgi:hypothetical protein